MPSARESMARSTHNFQTTFKVGLEMSPVHLRIQDRRLSNLADGFVGVGRDTSNKPGDREEASSAEPRSWCCWSSTIVNDSSSLSSLSSLPPSSSTSTSSTISSYPFLPSPLPSASHSLVSNNTTPIFTTPIPAYIQNTA